MREFILFVDTETSGLPKNWGEDFTNVDAWPHVLQLSWVIYTREGELVREEDHFIHDPEVHIEPSSLEVHSLTPEFLAQNGDSREQAYGFLHRDLVKYQPMLVAHFAKLDLSLIRVGFERVGLEDVLDDLPVFCTMKGNTNYASFPHVYHPGLDELYHGLFKKPLENQHNALADARATAACFFELRDRGEITDALIKKQQKQLRFGPRSRWSARSWFNKWTGAIRWVVLLLSFL